MASIDLSTFHRIPWENNVSFSLVSFFDPKTLAPICGARSALHDMECIFGVEFEASNLSQSCGINFKVPHSVTAINFGK
ncbi:hypothetical protein BDR03DRAFT_953477 [Suillus americanus]|nr:hypothetical protein BDR03DRAFT_953477 [Suillus americanus]